MKATLQTKLSQRLTLTPQLTLSLKVLAMNRLELDHYLEECIERNPLLESELPEPSELPPAPEAKAAPSAEEVAGDNRWERLYQPAGDGESLDRLAQLEERPSLHEALRLQLDRQPMGEQERLIAYAILDALDDDGLFRADLEAFAAEYGVSAEAVERVLQRHIHQLEPAGIGARDLTECLLLQLDPQQPVDRVARTLLVHHADLLGGDPEALAQASGFALADVRAAIERMRRLDPFPGHDLGGQGGIYIEPEIVFHRNDEGGFDVEVPRSAYHRIRINDYWKDAKLSGADKKFVEEALREARWLLQSLSQRRETLLKLGICLARRQRRMLESGFLAIQPLTMRDVAEDLGVHESTISRVVQGKYAGTPFGTVPLKSFFSAGLQTRGGGTISTCRVHQRIKALIETEPPGKPISDQAIAEKLQMEGIEIARRTVAKYREQLGLPSSSQRRRAAKNRQTQMRR